MNTPLSKREQNRLQRRDQIVAVATRSFLEHGFDATSMSQIAGELGGSKGTLWAHFSTKEELFAAVIDRVAEDFVREITDLLANQPFSRAGVRQFALVFLQRLTAPERASFMRILIGEGGRFPNIGREFYARGPSRMRERFEQYCQNALGEEEGFQVARILMLSLLGFRTETFFLPPEDWQGRIESFVDALIDHLLPEERAVVHPAPIA